MSANVEVILPSDTAVEVRRLFATSRQMLFDCHTQPALVRRWLLGPPGWEMIECEVDLRAGGRYRYVWRSQSLGRQFGVEGDFREIKAPERIVNVERMEGQPGEAKVVTSFIEQGAETVLSVLIDYGSKVARDAAVATGMTGGMGQSYERLEAEILNAA
jgi:uncharacterized protein YndB with AHSA1/START domain